MQITTTQVPQQSTGLGHSMALNGIFAVGFVLFLMIAVVAEMLAWKWRAWLPGAEGNHSLIADVKGAVYTFMSHLL